MSLTARPLGHDHRAITPQRVASMLQRLHPGVRVRGVRVLAEARCGDGVASTADRIVLGVDYEPSADAGLPPQMILKTRLLHPALRFGVPAVRALARASAALSRLPVAGAAARALLFVGVGAYQRFFPHAPDPMYAGEVRFYTEIRPELEIEAPRAHGGLFEPTTRRFGILMEDLGLRGASFPSATGELPLATLRGLLEQLARLHARFWASPRWAGELAWLPDRLSGGMFPVFDGIGRELVRYQVERHAAKAAAIRGLGRGVDELWAAMWACQRRLAAGPPTLIHGDAHVGNTYVLPDGTGGLLDFQLAARGHWANDVTYLLTTSLGVAARRAHERELLAHYLAALASHGVADLPDEAEAWRAHRLAALWGLVIGWLITPPVNYGLAITEANIARCAAACGDLDPFALLR